MLEDEASFLACGLGRLVRVVRLGTKMEKLRGWREGGVVGVDDHNMEERSFSLD